MSRPRSSNVGRVLVPLVGLLLCGCAHRPEVSWLALRIAPLVEPVQVDGRLEEKCYQRPASVREFQVASRPEAQAPPTQAWLQWDQRGLWFAFAAQDSTLVAGPATLDEHAVDAQDRVELFLWPEDSRQYFCLEIAPEGAVHDYAARLYRRFDDSWSPAGARFAARGTAKGYAVEGFVPVEALHRMGVRSWRAGTRFRLGLYRADFRSEAPDAPQWLSWIDPNLPEPDFHTRATFGLVELGP